MAADSPQGNNGIPVVVIISLCASCCLILVVAGCTWSWWRKWSNRCLGRNSQDIPEASWSNPNSRTFATLDPSTLERRSSHDHITVEPLPTLTMLDIDPRQSFELRRTKYPSIVPSSDEHNVRRHDWFHHPYTSFPRIDIEFNKVIGKGWFGKVIEAEAKNLESSILKTKKVIAKRLRDDANDLEQMRFLNECRLYRESEHGNVLKLIGFAVETMPYIVMLESFPLGDLKSFLIGKKKCGEESLLYNQGIIIRMAIDIVKGLEWMFSTGFVHEDLSARNCLVANTAGKVIIGDYGLSTQKFPKDYYKKSNYAIPIRWIAPESVNFSENSFQTVGVTPMSTIWSFGILLWELFQFGRLPYAEMSDEDVIKRVLINKTYILEPPDFPYLQDSAKDKLYKLMLNCWNSVPENRPTIQSIGELLSSP